MIGLLRRRPRTTRVVLGLIFLSALAAFWLALPDPLFKDPVSVVVLGRDGELLGARIADDGQWRFPVIRKVPEKFRQAIILYEDRRFAWHPGVDPAAIIRALWLNTKQGRVVSGGSTLSMQVIRLARHNPSRSYREKLLEIVLALRLELSHRKDTILTLYASHAPFGGNVVGLEAAAWRYFGRHPDQLSWAETATLAVLPNSPGLIHPGRNRKQLRERRDRLLNLLAAHGHLSPLDLKLALAEPLPEQPHALPQTAPHLLATLHQLYPGQNRFTTTIERERQISVQDSVTRHMAKLQRQLIQNAAVLVVDNHSFEILAYIGNSRWDSSGDDGMSVDIVQRPRSTGSLLKPFLFAAMLDSGEILPTTLIPDVPTQYSGYIPENFDKTFRGAVSAQVALVQSLNVPSVRMLRMHGIGRFQDYLRELGMTTLNRPSDQYGLSLILGGAEGTPWELTGLYANLVDVARRHHSEPTPYRRLRILSTTSDTTDRPARMTPAAAWITLNTLLEVARPPEEAQWRQFATARKIAWKTGTSYGLRDAWAIGSSSRYTVAVWVGNASGEGRSGLTGAAAAAPLMFDIFNRLEASPWLAPPLAHLKEVEICLRDGFLATSDCEKTAILIPRHSHFDHPSPHHRIVHLDPQGQYRVHAGCESPSRMIHRPWFILPTGQEHYYRRHHPDYRLLPPYRQDCVKSAEHMDARGPIDFLYPNFGTKIYIPIDLAGARGRVLFEAVHREPRATLHWHLDDRYLGSTKHFHQQALDMAPGHHTITVVDQDGSRLSRRFEVLDKNQRQ